MIHAHLALCHRVVKGLPTLTTRAMSSVARRLSGLYVPFNGAGGLLWHIVLPVHPRSGTAVAKFATFLRVERQQMLDLRRQIVYLLTMTLRLAS